MRVVRSSTLAALSSVSFIALAFGLGSPALAQEAPNQPPSPSGAAGPAPNRECLSLPEGDARDRCIADQPQDADGTPPSNTIIVTGSRIRLPQLESREPIVVLDEEYIEDRNITNVADALNELPAYRGSVTPAGSQGTYGQGVNFVNNFGLGSNRTLTLINGRRFVSSNVPTIFNNAAQGTQVDLNVIPTILIDRVDTIAVGGAPVYGSDAISGTVNVILKTRFDGIVVSGTTGITERGDNFRYNVSGVAGFNFLGDRGNVTVAVSHDQVEGLLQNDRSFYRDNILTRPNVFGEGNPANAFRLNPNFGANTGDADGIPPNVRFRDGSIPFLSYGGVIFGGPLNLSRAFDGQGNLAPFNRGASVGSIFAVGGEGFQFSDFGQIESDLRRTIGNLFANYDITDNINVFFEGTYFKSRADELVQQPTFNTPFFGGASGGLVFSSNNPFLTAQARGVLADAGVRQFTMSRASTDLADLTGYGQNEIHRGVIGLRGEFEGFGRNFNWEVSANRGRAEITTFRQDLNRQNFINAVNVTRDASGNIVCTTAPTRAGGNGFAAPGGVPIADPSCVPLNLFGSGVASQAALDYVIAESEALAILDQTVFNANIGGTLFDIWGAGPVGFNVGAEHRKEEGDFRPSEFEQEGLGRAVAIKPVRGDFTVKEVFGEVLVPLVAPANNFPVIYNAEVYGRARYVDNTVNGGFLAWTAGGSVAPIRDIELRGNFTRSFRAPAITELFQPKGNAFGFVPRLCQDPGAGPNPDARQRNCDAFLGQFPNALLDPSGNASIPITVGGNPDLQNEEADAYTIGTIIRPRFLPQLAITVDYIDIKLRQPITFLNAAAIASACFDNDNFDTSNPAQGNTFCSLIRRNPPGTLGPNPTDPNGPPIDIGGFVINDPANPGVSTGYVNGVLQKFSGVQATLNYALPRNLLGLPGKIELGGDLLYVRRRVNDLTGVASTRVDGEIGDPKWSAQARLRYSQDTFGVATFFNYVGKQLFDRDNRGIEFFEVDHYNPYVTVNGAVWFTPTDRYRLTLSVTNLFDRQGQEYFGTKLGINDALGRRFAATARVNF